MVTTSKGQNQSQKVKAPRNLLWLTLRKDLLAVRAIQLWDRVWKARAPPLQARLPGAVALWARGGLPGELVSLLSREAHVLF